MSEMKVIRNSANRVRQMPLTVRYGKKAQSVYNDRFSKRLDQFRGLAEDHSDADNYLNVVKAVQHLGVELNEAASTPVMSTMPIAHQNTVVPLRKDRAHGGPQFPQGPGFGG